MLPIHTTPQTPRIPVTHHNPLAVVGKIAVAAFSFLATYYKTHSFLKATVICLIATTITHAIASLVTGRLAKNSLSTVSREQDALQEGEESDDFAMIEGGDKTSALQRTSTGGIVPDYERLKKEGKI